MITKKELMLSKLDGTFEVKLHFSNVSNFTCNYCNGESLGYACIQAMGIHDHICKECLSELLGEEYELPKM